jgi:DNA-binding MarR family transcriptional regulator
MKTKGIYKYAYASHKLGVQDKEILELLRQKIPCRILLHFFFVASCSQIELSKELNLHPSTVSYHLKKMVEMGIIEEAPVENGIIYPYPNPGTKVISKTPRGREIFYRRKNQEIFAAVGRIMIAHKDSLDDAQYIDEFFSYFRSLVDWGLYSKKVKKDIAKKVVEKDGKKVTLLKLPSEEDFYDFVYELFKPPFCA